MKSDQAYRWAQRALDFEVRVGALQFLDWVGFEKEFRKDFTPLNAEATAVNTLEGTSYFQGRCSVDDYLDQFRCQREFCFTWVSPNQCIIGLFQLFVGRLLKCSYPYFRVEV